MKQGIARIVETDCGEGDFQREMWVCGKEFADALSNLANALSISCHL